ncbi:ATP-dependent DNA helicase RecG [Sphingomonas kaistensis]|uniref:ATP-dependent DNA helicase RecG n=1 Tax=Sphingomonas kaistensis TaxID=298708 RepID=A0A7X5Y7Q0_9SPHN|nr:ATP-binding protein [Sphingomonas kaistensis]NJC05066.1 ATP-dependent DNA helicase RecG [Sphingomonas kaistensis]
MVEQLGFPDFIRASPPQPSRLELWTPDDIFNSLTPELISAFEEDYRVDRKSARISARDLADDVCAFANSAPHGGVLLVGVENDGSIGGLSCVAMDKVNALYSVGDFCPDARLDFRTLEVMNKRGEPDRILLLRVFFRDNRLVETTSGTAYIRQGDRKRRISEEEKREIRISRGEIDYEKEPVKLSYPEEFNQKLITEFADSFRSIRGLSREHSNEEILTLNHLGKGTTADFRPNLACALLFSKDPRAVCPGARIRFQRFDGVEEGTGSSYNLIQDSFIDGAIPVILNDAEEIISKQMRNFTRLGKNGRFFTRPEYPKDAWIEAVTNALVHRSYNYRNMVVFVKMFDDRFTVESPGGFLPPVTPENIYDTHNPRNPFLMEALFYFGFVKCAHEGTRRMRDAMGDVGLPSPEFSQREVGHFQVHATLRNNLEARKTFVDANAALVLGDKLLSSLNGKEKMVVNYIAEHEGINVSDASRLLSCDWRTAKRLLDSMADKEVLERFSVTGKERDPKSRYILRTT